MSEAILDLPAPPADLRLSYGPAPLQFGDLRLPATPAPHPLVLLIHGGFWRSRYSLEHLGHLAAALTASGLATWNLEYRRVGDTAGGWPNTLLDLALAAATVRQLAPRYQLDLDRVLALGHSAGGQLALWLAARRRLPPTSELFAPQPLALRGVIALAAVSDLRLAYELALSDTAAGELLGGSPQRWPERYAEASPIELLPVATPAILIHGDADATVPLHFSERYLAAAQAAGAAVELQRLPALGHFEPIDPRSAAWPSVRDAVWQLLGERRLPDG